MAYICQGLALFFVLFVIYKVLAVAIVTLAPIVWFMIKVAAALIILPVAYLCKGFKKAWNWLASL